MTQPNLGMLKRIAAQLRKEDIQALTTAGSGHPGGSLSIIDVLTVLYFGKILHYDPCDSHWEDRDRLVLSKGHTCPGLYCALAYANFFPKEELATLRKFGSRLQGHTDLNLKTPGVETCGGPLGQGLSVGLGMAIGLKINGKKSRVYTIIGDGESAKGGITEAAKCAGVMKMNNMITFLDYNKVDQDGAVKDVLPCRFEEEWQSYGWKTFRVDGRDVQQIYHAIQSAQALQEKESIPVLIVLDTIKGAGISFMAAAAEKGDSTWHGVTPKGDDAKNALAECDALLAKLAAEFPGSMDAYLQSAQWTPADKHAYTVPHQEKINAAPAIIPFEQPAATRDALGKYIVALGKTDSRIVTVTAGVAGSVKFEDFAKQFGTFSATNRSGRFVQVGIAEANMAGVAAGLGLVGKKPWMATFDIFVKECLGVIRNSICYADADVKIIGTHAGLGVEWDGGSHQSTIVPGIMADLFRMESYEPADCNETQRLMKLMYEQNKAAYFRLTRQKLPVYSSSSYHYGTGARMVKDVVKNAAHGVPSVVLLGSAAGLDLAMSAAVLLEKENISVRVIDVYSLSHLNTDAFRKLIPADVLLATVHDAHHKLLAREVAYSLAQIGQGNKIISFGMQEFGETGSLADLYKKHGMDVESIVKKVKENL
ncbi:hypothetical protein HZA99_00665 [Candidatus Woesearchaeota archaeon]|nr:hypothetical protein [Candidatus Woesearchaeota archaeon]